MAKPPPRRVDYEKELRRRGVRITRPRRVILGILSETEDHPDALEIFRRAVAVDGSISLSTVYRTMKLLGDIGAWQPPLPAAAVSTKRVANSDLILPTFLGATSFFSVMCLPPRTN